MTEDGVLYYDANHELQNKRKFFETLENMSQPVLVKEIKMQIRQKKELMKRVEELEKLIIQDNNILKGNAGKGDTKEVEKEKKIISKQFDEAFHISPSPKRMNKTYSRAISKKPSFPHHAFSLSEWLLEYWIFEINLLYTLLFTLYM